MRCDDSHRMAHRQGPSRRAPHPVNEGTHLTMQHPKSVPSISDVRHHRRHMSVTRRRHSIRCDMTSRTPCSPLRTVSRLISCHVRRAHVSTLPGASALPMTRESTRTRRCHREPWGPCWRPFRAPHIHCRSSCSPRPLRTLISYGQHHRRRHLCLFLQIVKLIKRSGI